jgi:hypothetical protein
MNMDIDRMLDYLSKASIFDHSALCLFLILAMSLSVTLIHTLQEWKDPGGPVWLNFGAMVGVEVPNWLGWPVFLH